LKLWVLFSDRQNQLLTGNVIMKHVSNELLTSKELIILIDILQIRGGKEIRDSIAEVASRMSLISVPKNVSDFVNDSGYLTLNDISGLTGGVSLSIVDALPEQDINSSTIYLVRNDSEDENNKFTEYVRINDSWEILGSRSINLEDYVKISEFSIAVERAQKEMTAVDGSVVQVDDSILKIDLNDNEYIVLLNHGGLETRLSQLETKVSSIEERLAALEGNT